VLVSSVLLSFAGSAAVAQGPVAEPVAAAAVEMPVTISLKSKCAGSDVEIVVCGQKGTTAYRIDPAVLSAARSRDAVPEDSRSPQQKADVHSCHDEPSKCQGSGVIPLLPAALKIAQAALLAVEGEDWREPFRTKADEYQLYRQGKAKQKRVSIGVSASASH